MERSSSSSPLSLRLIQQAKEELELLESHHPNRFHYLKLDLQSFIFIHSQNPNTNSSSSSPPNNTFSSSSATTQASSNSGRKRKRGSDGDRVDEVLKKAQVCLQKIRDLKDDFFCS